MKTNEPTLTPSLTPYSEGARDYMEEADTYACAICNGYVTHYSKHVNLFGHIVKQNLCETHAMTFARRYKVKYVHQEEKP